MALIWSDECDKAAGEPPDSSKWTRRTGGRWGNGRELQQYTARESNAVHDGQGNLVITARRETYTGSDGVRRDYTSARLDTQGKFAVVKGYVEVVAKVGLTQGAFPAIWTLGGDPNRWPAGGELDILECTDARLVARQTVHGPPSNWTVGWSGPGAINLPTISTDFHAYGVYFDEREIQFYIDREPTMRVARGNRPDGEWPWGRVPQWLLLNYAIGHAAGDPGPGTWPQALTVQSVRVYDAVPSETPAPPVEPPPPPPEPPLDLAGIRADLLSASSAVEAAIRKLAGA